MPTAPDTTKKPFKPLTADQPAASGQRAKEQECSFPSINPSASPAPPSNKPAEGKHTADKQEKKAAFKRAEIYSILYKYAHERSFQIKKAALKSSIRWVGLDAVIGAINAGCAK